MIRQNVLVLGFYDRHNLGDELYKIVIPKVISQFSSSKYAFSFKCTDDIQEVPPHTDIIVCGGGDIINSYFMEKVKLLIAGFRGAVYAVSVGIPFDENVKYLHMFDHIFVRSTTDRDIAVTEVGSHNVTYIPDFGFQLKPAINYRSFQACINRVLNNNIGLPLTNIGIFPATPYMKVYPDLLGQLVKLCVSLLAFNSSVRLNFYPFNTSTNTDESDFIFINAIIGGLSASNRNRCVIHTLTNPLDMLSNMKRMNFNICMRFHSIVFSIINNTAFIPVFNTKKISNILKDVGYPHGYMVNIDSIPMSTVADAIMQKACMFMGGLEQINFDEPSIGDTRGEGITNVFTFVPKLQEVLAQKHLPTLNEVIDTLRITFINYFGTDYLNTMLDVTGPLPLHDHDPLEVASIICYSVTKQLDNPCVWGLKDNLSHDDFNLFEAIKYIYQDYLVKNALQDGEHYYTQQAIHDVLFDLDPYVDNNFSCVHRAGWGFVVNELAQYDAGQYRRQGTILVDTFVDRTFHWGFATLKAAKKIPYKRPWIGFIHHTFDTTHSSYNCVELFKNPLFIESLAECKCLITLSEYLANQIRTTLQILQIHVPVQVIYHPTEIPEVKFTFEKFLASTNRKVVQIGAWLRKPYSIYELGLELDNPLHIHKYALRGRDMQLYFCPTDFFEKFTSTFLIPSDKPYLCDGSTLNTTSINKYLQGMYNTLVKNNNSVHVISRLTNEEYDDLLAQNIVFLDLVDCSAVNTVIECMARNTPLIINRHPAVAELLGVDYPGFYDTLGEALRYLHDEQKLRECYEYMLHLDKTPLYIDTFKQQFIDLIKKFI